MERMSSSGSSKTVGIDEYSVGGDDGRTRTEAGLWRRRSTCGWAQPSLEAVCGSGEECRNLSAMAIHDPVAQGSPSEDQQSWGRRTRGWGRDALLASDPQSADCQFRIWTELEQTAPPGWRVKTFDCHSTYRAFPGRLLDSNIEGESP